MWRRRLHHRFPVFFSYTAFHILITFTLLFLALRHNYRYYFYAFWASAPIMATFNFGIVYEMFHAMFHHREGLKDFGTMLFRWAAVMIVLTGTVLALSSAGLETHQWMKFILSIDRATQVMMFGLLLFVVLFANHLGIERRHKVFGITVGLGLFAFADLVLATQFTRSWLSASLFNVVHPLIYDLTVFIWLCYMLSPEPLESLPNMLLKSQRWNEELLEVPYPDGQPTLLLGIESLVDRALNKGRRGE
jgi:hypothetical protein